MKRCKNALLFTLVLLPVAALAGYFTVRYQFDLYDPALLETAVAQLGSLEIVMAISVAQTVMYAAVCGFVGYILAEKLGLMKAPKLNASVMRNTLLLSLAAGLLFSLDYWSFGAWLPGVRESTAAGLTVWGWLASILYGGIIEEVMLRLFVMSLLAWVLWKLFYRKHETAPTGVIVAANIIAALGFAAGHLPATVQVFGQLTPLILIRCFLFNGSFGLLFGWLYRKYGIAYAMLSHALVHIVSKLIWTIFL